MNILRKAAIAAAATLLVVLLFGFGFAWSAHQVFGSSTAVKQALRTSGIYTSVVGEALDQAQKKGAGTSATGDNQVPVNDPAIRQIIEQAFPPSYLQSQTEGVIDSSYAWANGKTNSLQFKIDLTSAKARLADGVGNYAQQHLASLPACTADNIPTGDVDPFSATCVPPGFDIASASAKARDNILNGDFLKNSTITADTIKDNHGKTLNQQVQHAPQAYHKGILGLYSSIVLAVGLAVGIVFMSITWRKGLHKVSVIAITVGVVSALLGWLSSFTVQKVATKIASGQTADRPLQLQLIHIVQSLANDLRTWWMSFGIVLIVLGVGTLVALHFTKPKEKKTTSEPESGGGMIDNKLTPSEPAPHAPVKKGPPKPRGKIQL